MSKEPSGCPGNLARQNALRESTCIARMTGVFAVSHLVVDLACIYCVLGPVRLALGGGTWELGVAVMAYDMLAFALQLPLGALLDRLGERGARPALFSFALVAVGVVLSAGGSGAMCVASVTALALGNALFHDAGGVRLLGVSDGRLAPSGVFIATGAIGVFLGMRAGVLDAGLVSFALVASLACCAVLVVLAHRARGMEGGAVSTCEAPGPFEVASPREVLEPVGTASSSHDFASSVPVAFALLCVTVALRSYTGMVMAFPWKAQPLLAVVAILAVALGKASGGFVADRMGLPLASVVSLGGAALLFPLSWESVVAGVAATFLFNFTMPITLVSLARLVPGEPGLAFGAASFSLAVGALPALFGLLVQGPWVLAALSGASLVALLAGLRAAGEGHAGCGEMGGHAAADHTTDDHAAGDRAAGDPGTDDC